MQERPLAFFDFCCLQSGDRCEFGGVCKISKSAQDAPPYLSFRFIFDAPSRQKKDTAREKLMTVSTALVRKFEPAAKLVTSVPSSLSHINFYIHHIDVLFETDFPQDLKDSVSKILSALREATGFDTESPLWCEESKIPFAPSCLETLGAEVSATEDRLMALLSAEGVR